MGSKHNKTSEIKERYMGCSPFKNSNTGYGREMYPTPSLVEETSIDPRSLWRINEFTTIGNYILVQVCYFKCKNYEGNKIILFSSNKTIDSKGVEKYISEIDFLDPHFREGANIIARFEPTNKGWNLARAFVEYLTSEIIK